MTDGFELMANMDKQSCGRHSKVLVTAVLARPRSDSVSQLTYVKMDKIVVGQIYYVSCFSLSICDMVTWPRIHTKKEMVAQLDESAVCGCL